MNDFRYKVIKSEDQYAEYCDLQMQLLNEDEEKYKDDLELLNLLLDKWEQEHYPTEKAGDPIELISIIMEDHGLKAKDLAEILGLTKGTVSKILNYQKGLSKQSIRILADHFKIQQEALNKPYALVNQAHVKQKQLTSKQGQVPPKKERQAS